MFRRVAAWALALGMAAVLAIWPVITGPDTDTSAAANVPLAGVALDTAPEPIQAPAEQQAQPPEKPAQEQALPEKQAQEQAPSEKPAQEQAPPDIPARDDAQASQRTARPKPSNPQIAEPALPDLFGLQTLPVTTGNVVTKWNGVSAKIAGEREILARCRENAEHCTTAARDFLAVVATGSAQSGRTRIGLINRAVNLAVRPESDLAQWGVPDRWSPPLETFTTGRGDCEDYAIAKYVALTEAGLSPQDVKLVIVRNTAANEDHAVAAVRLDGGWIVLDNRWLTLVEDVAMPQVIPLFVLDNDGVRRFVPAPLTAARRAPAPASL
jgi:predicted transglutaminase-like cysteine proteinase